MAAASGRRSGRAFTLVELLVVIAIIGVLVALLLPAVQAAREAARRTQCLNQVRQMCLAVLNLESANKTFPSGGIEPWPCIESYSSGGTPFGPSKQGLSWAFQVLPYLEEGAVHNLSTTTQIANTPVSLYFCPSRRQPTSHSDAYGKYWLMDYAALTAAPSRSRIGNNIFDALLAVNNPVVPNTLPTSRGCTQAYSFWGTINYSNDFDPLPRSSSQMQNSYTGFWGVIVRSSYHIRNPDPNHRCPPPSQSPPVNVGYEPLVRMGKIKDGTSKTAMITEKRLQVPYNPGVRDDDRGWSDGWDVDTMRLSLCPPYPDSTKQIVGLGGSDHGNFLTAGSAHSAGFTIGFADGSTRFLSYGVDLETFNRMAHRADGELYKDPTN